MRLALEVVGAPEAAAGIEGGYTRMYIAAAKEMGVQMLGLRNYTITEHLHGPTGPTTLQQRTGNLARSIATEVQDQGNAITGLVGIPAVNTVPYAMILHEGGTTRAHVIEASAGNSLAFMVGGVMTFRRKVNHPGSVFPARPYLTASLEEQGAAIKASLSAAMIASVK